MLSCLKYVFLIDLNALYAMQAHLSPGGPQCWNATKCQGFCLRKWIILWQQIVFDLWPVGICCRGYKKISVPISDVRYK